jgi:hypothetical protein
MRLPYHRLAIAVLATLILAVPARSQVTHVDANFNDKTVDQPIGTGGPTVGEPVTLDGVPGFVRSGPFPTPSLEIADVFASGARAVRFAFPNSFGVTGGTLTFSMDLKFESLDGYNIYIREPEFSAVSFLDMTFTSDGSVIVSDLNGLTGSFAPSYQAGVTYHLTLAYNLDLLTYTLTFGDFAPLVNEPLGAIPAGIGSILIGVAHDPDVTGVLHLDNLLVTGTQLPQPVTATTWSRIKALAR